MKRTKPTQPIYRPGSGLLRKSNTFEDSESDTNLVRNSKRQVNNDNGEHTDILKHKSEGNSPREQVATLKSFGDSSGDTVFNDSSRRVRKPEKLIYVPRSIAQSRENTVQPSNSNSFSNFNGNNEMNVDRNRDNVYSNTNQAKPYVERRDDQQEAHSRWGDGPYRQRQGSEPRGRWNIFLYEIFFFIFCYTFVWVLNQVS